MKVRMCRYTQTDAGMLSPGIVYDVPAAEARELVRRGDATLEAAPKGVAMAERAVDRKPTERRARRTPAAK